MPDVTDDSWFSDDIATFGDRLAAAREAQGLSQEEFAQRLGVKLRTVRHWEEDAKEPRANRLQMIAGMFGVSIMWLLTGQGTAPTEDGDDTSVRLLKQELTRLRDDATTIVERLDRTIERLGSE